MSASLDHQQKTASLCTEQLCISFGGHTAVNQVSAAFYPGSLSVIVGPNGAGKTTYFNLISGQLAPTSGRVLLHGVDISDEGAATRTQKGIGRAFQLSNLFPHLTVMENVRLAVQGKHQRRLQLLSRWRSHRDWIEKAAHFLDRVALTARQDELVANLSHGDKRKLEVALLLALEPTVMMFDEPTAGMSIDEVPVILDLIHDIKVQGQHTVLLVEHKMDVVRALADRVMVLHNGCLLADGDPATVMASPLVQEAYLGANAKESSH